jgi:pimeloyl-ACP methyl ester carboxylesterase
MIEAPSMASFVLVHGICHGAWCWEDTCAALDARGHRPVAVDLELTSLEADATVVRRALDGLDGPTVLVGHSYGGLVISRAAGARSDVAHLVYVAAVMIDRDDVFIARAADFPPSPLAELAAICDGIITVSPQAAAKAFYNECGRDEAARAAARLRPTAIACLAVPPEHEPWRSIPSTYVLCERDRAILPEAQR